MQSDPPWSQCLHLRAGTCPRLWLEGPSLCAGRHTPRPELSQDLALLGLAEACADCALKPQTSQR